VRLRPAAAEDAEAVTACVQAAYAHYVERIGARPGPMNDDYAKLIGEGRVTVADEGGSAASAPSSSPTPKPRRIAGAFPSSGSTRTRR
jgi:hypothetical protein